MKKLMIVMLGLSFLGATAMVAQTPAPTEKSDTAKKPAKKATTKKADTAEKKADTAKKPAKKAAKKADTSK